MQLHLLLVRHGAGRLLCDQSSFHRGSGNLLGVEPAPVVGDFHYHLAGLVARLDADGPGRALARAQAGFHALETVIGGIADHVRERVRQTFNQGLVEPNVLATNVELDVLLGRARHIAHHAGKLAQDIADGLHARVHDRVLQLGSDQVDALEASLHVLARGLPQGRPQLIAAEHQLARQVHQRFQELDAHPQGTLHHHPFLLAFPVLVPLLAARARPRPAPVARRCHDRGLRRFEQRGHHPRR